MTCGTLACVAGGDPEKMQQLPDTTGIKNEVIVPSWSRSTYDHAVRTTGIKMVEVTSKRRKGFPSETRVKRGQRIVHGHKLLEEKLGRNDHCPCGSRRR